MPNNQPKQKSNSYAAFFIMAMLLFAGAAIKNFLPDSLKMPWSVLVLIGSVAAVVYFLKDFLRDKRSVLLKAVDIVVFLFILLCIADLVFSFPFFNNIRQFWGKPILMIAAAIAFALLTQLLNRGRKQDLNEEE